MSAEGIVMLKAGNQKLALRCFALMLLVPGLFLLTKDSARASLSPTQGRSPLPVASIAPQDDAPLRIINTFLESGPEGVTLKVMAQNQSGKRIRAYALVADGGGVSMIDFANLTTAARLLRPTQIETFGFSYGEDNTPRSVTLSIDFVEFEDGSVWGRDAHNSRDRLAGQREGAKAERQRLKAILKSGGTSAVFSAVREEVPDTLEVNASKKRTGEWIEGYRNGVASMRNRLRRNLQSSDPADVERELARPFDQTETKP